MDGVERASDGFDGVCRADGVVWDDDANVKIAVCSWGAIGIRAFYWLLSFLPYSSIASLGRSILSDQ